MQRWTKTKPNKPGYWWAKNGKDINILHIMLVEDVLYSTTNFVVILDSPWFDNFEWGSAPIVEPVGEKI